MTGEFTDYRALFAYNSWANREILNVLRNSPDVSEKSLGLFGHVLAVERLWLDRLLQQKQAMATWPTLTIEEMATLLEQMENHWKEYLGDEARLRENRAVEYVNWQGVAFQNRPTDILTQVLFHGVHHRGQISINLRAAGIAPPVTDYIHAVRSNALV